LNEEPRHAEVLLSDGDEVRLSLVDKMRFVAETRSAHQVVVDLSVDAGSDDAGARPMELLLVAGGSCMGMDTISILRKMRQDVTSYEISVSGERATEHPRVFTAITMVHRLRGPSIVEANVARALQLSISRYCPVYAMLGKIVEVTVRYEVTDAGSGVTSTGEVVRELPTEEVSTAHRP
jgi:putative redox protein